MKQISATLLSLFMALPPVAYSAPRSGSGPSVELYKVGTANIKDDAVTSDKIAALAVETGNIQNDAVTSDKIADGAITSGAIGTGAVTTEKLADDAVTSSKILNGQVTTEKLGDDAIITVKLMNKAVTTPKLATDSVTNEKLISDNASLFKVTGGAMTASAARNIGIGTTSPLSKLYVDTGMAMLENVSNRSGITPKATLDIYGGEGNSTLAAAALAPQIGVNADDTGGAWHGIGIGYTNGTTGVYPTFLGALNLGGGGNLKAALVFGTRDTTTATDPPIERMRVDSTGNVGIGTTSPGTKLEVAEATAADAILTVQGGEEKAAIIYLEPDLDTDAADTYWINAYQDGSLYIGRADVPLATGGLALEMGASADTVFKVIGDEAKDGMFSIRADNGDTTGVIWDVSAEYVGSGDADFQIKRQDVAAAFFIDGSAGNVGIGTTSPTSGKLHIQDSGSTSLKIHVGDADSHGCIAGNAADGTVVTCCFTTSPAALTCN